MNEGFAITPVQLRMWAGLNWQGLPFDGVERLLNGVRVPCRRAYLWLHPNQFGWRDHFDPLRPAVRFELDTGITVYGNGEQVGSDEKTKTLPGPRLPLLGLRALTGMDARLVIDAARRLVSLDLPD